MLIGSGSLGAGGRVRLTGSPAQDIVRIASEQDVDLVLVDGTPELLAMPCSEACSPSTLRRRRSLSKASSNRAVLVPFVGAEHDWAAVELGAWTAGALGVSLLIAGPREAEGERDASRLLAQRVTRRSAGPRHRGRASSSRFRPEALLSAAEPASVVVIGLNDALEKERARACARSAYLEGAATGRARPARPAPGRPRPRGEHDPIHLVVPDVTSAPRGAGCACGRPGSSCSAAGRSV